MKNGISTLCLDEEYEPNSLKEFFASFERHLKKKKAVDFALSKTSSSINLGKLFSQSKGIENGMYLKFLNFRRTIPTYFQGFNRYVCLKRESLFNMTSGQDEDIETLSLKF